MPRMSSKGVRIKDNDRLYKAFKKKIEKVNRAEVSVGIFDQKAHPGNAQRNARNNSGDALSVVEVGAIHEFGVTGAGRNKNVDIPQRSFLRSTADEQQPAFVKIIRQQMRKVIDNKTSLMQMLQVLGFQAQEMVRNRIKGRIAPPLEPSTVAAKRGGSLLAPEHPLVDSGRLLNSITFKAKIK